MNIIDTQFSPGRSPGSIGRIPSPLKGIMDNQGLTTTNRTNAQYLMQPEFSVQGDGQYNKLPAKTPKKDFIGDFIEDALTPPGSGGSSGGSSGGPHDGGGSIITPQAGGDGEGQIVPYLGTVQPWMTVAGNLNEILNQKGPLMTRARSRGQQFAESRGLLNSSLAGTAGEAAMIDAAVPIAQQDASTYFTQAITNQTATNQFRMARLNQQFTQSNLSLSAALSRQLARLQGSIQLGNQTIGQFNQFIMNLELQRQAALDNALATRGDMSPEQFQNWINQINKQYDDAIAYYRANNQDVFSIGNGPG